MEVHPIDDYVEAQFAGQAWKLSLGLRAEVEFERRAKPDKDGNKRSIGSVLGRYVAADGGLSLKSALDGFDAEDFCLLLWCMTIRHHPGIEHEAFIDLLSVKDLRSMLRDVMQAAEAFHGTPQPGDEGGSESPNGQRIGTPSGRSVASLSNSRKRRHGT